MKSDLDALMQSRGLDGLLIVGPALHNPYMYYFTGGVHVSDANLFIKRGAEPLLFYSPMERDEAARTGLPTRSMGDFPFNEMMKEAGGNILLVRAKIYQKMFEAAGLTSGKVALAGHIDAGAAFGLFSTLHKLLPDLEIVSDMQSPLMMSAMATKDGAEVERIRAVGKITIDVVGQVAEFLTSHAVKNDMLVKPDGQPLTIGEVKSRIDLWLAKRGAENPEMTIFAIGHDAGVPHSAGNPADFLRLGQTIVFDIYPCEAGGGYFHDFTRTWCLGYAPDEALELYETVRSVYQQVTGALCLDMYAPDLQKMACELFEAKGHPTIHSKPGTLQGYVHGLGHGVGLNIHERPYFNKLATPEDCLKAGTVMAIEPGLYYPERGLGMRLENTFWARPDGVFEVLADYPMDLILKVK